MGKKWKVKTKNGGCSFDEKVIRGKEKNIKDIASEYGIHYNTARKAVQGKTWKDLPLAE